MIVLGGLVLICLVVAAVVASTWRRGAPIAPLEQQLADWQAAGLLDATQVAAITEFELSRRAAATPVGAPASTSEVAAPAGAAATAIPTSTTGAAAHAGAAPTGAVLATAPRRGRGVSAIVEALGYLGGVLAVSGLLLLVANYWSDMSSGGQLALSGITAVVLFAGGAAVPERRDPAMTRLRAFLWTLSTASVCVFAVVAARAVFDPEPASRIVACGAAAVAVTSGLMWWGRFRPVQQFAALSAAVVAVGATVDQVSGSTVTGISVWLAGAVILGLGVRSVTTAPVLDVFVGSVAVGVGSVITMGDDPGAAMLFTLATGLAVLTIALLPRLVTGVASRIVLCVVGGITTLQSFPPTVAYFADEAAVVTGVVVWLGGLAVAAVGIRRLTRAPIVLEVLGAAVMLVGCAVTGADSPGFATLFGLVTALGLLGVSVLPGRVALSPIGALGLLVFVPWAIGWFFPGEGRVPLLISVSGVLIIGVAVLMARLGHRFGAELGRHHRPAAPHGPPPLG